MAPAPDRIFTYTRIHRAPDCAITWQERNIQNRDGNCNQIVGSGKTRNAAPARSISAVAFTRRETLLSGLRQSRYGAANPGRWRNPRQRSAAAQLSNGTVQLHSDGLGAAHGGGSRQSGKTGRGRAQSFGAKTGCRNYWQRPNNSHRQKPRAFRVAITQAGVSFEATC